MPTRQNRRASKGKPKSSTSFDNKKNKPQRNGQTRQGKSRSQTPKPKRKQSTSSWSSFSTPKRYSRKPSWSNSTTSKRSYNSKKSNLSMRSNRNVLHPNTCKFWNKSQCKKGKECEYAHFHFKFFHKTTIPTTNGTSQEINKQYSQQVEAGNLLVHISQISFMSWHQVQQLAKIMNTGVFQQTISIATLNKKAEHQYAKEIKNQRRIDDDPSLILDQKIHAFNQNYENLIKKDIKTEQQIKSLKNKTQSKNINQKIICHQNNNDQMVDESSKIKNNKQQQQSITKNDPKMEVEIDMSTSNKTKSQEQKNLLRRTSGGQQQKKQQEQTTPPSINLTTIQQEIKDLPKITLSKTTKTPSKDLTEQDPDKSLDEPAIIHEANELFAKIANKVDPKNIYELMRKATQEKKLPDDSTNLNHLLTTIIRYKQQENKKKHLIRNIYKRPYSLHNQVTNKRLTKKNEDKDRITHYTYAIASLITMTIQEYLTKEDLMNKEEKMNVEDIQMIIMNTFQKGVKDAYKMNHIIQLNKDENSPIFAAINIARDNVSKFTKIN
ncbi:hypothetical protein ABPG72_018604 [Tetrahymena utriculariae]